MVIVFLLFLVIFNFYNKNKNMGKEENVVFSILKNIDIYGIQFPLHYKKETKFSTPVSIIMSLISIILLIILLIYYLIILFGKKNFSIISSLTTEIKTVDFSEIPFLIGIKGKNGFIKLNNSIFEIKAQIVNHIFNESKNMNMIRDVKDLEFENCSIYFSKLNEKEICSIENFVKENNIDKYICLKSGQNISFHGRFGDSLNGFSILEIQIHKCNSSKYNCSTNEELISTLQNKFVSMIYLSHVINHYEKNKPFNLVLREESFLIEPTVIKQYYYKMNPTHYISYEGLLFDSIKNFYFAIHEKMTFDFVYTEEKEYHDNLSILEIIFDTTDYITQYKRSYMKLQDLFPLISGWYNCVYFLFKFISSYLSEKSLIVDLTNNLISPSCNNYCEKFMIDKDLHKSKYKSLNNNLLLSNSNIILNSPNFKSIKTISYIKSNNQITNNNIYNIHNNKINNDNNINNNNNNDNINYDNYKNKINNDNNDNSNNDSKNLKYSNLSTSIDFGNPLLIKLLNEYKQEGHQGKQIYKISYFDYIIPYKCLKRICKYSLLLLFSEVINGYLSLEKFLPMVESFTKMYFYGGNDDLIGKLKKNLFNFNKY